jgi:hypothetical protein
MNGAFIYMASLLGIDLGIIILIATMTGAIILYAADFRIGLMFSFIIAGCNFMFAYANHLTYTPALITTFLFLALMAISLYSTSKTQTQSSML